VIKEGETDSEIEDEVDKTEIDILSQLEKQICKYIPFDELTIDFIRGLLEKTIEQF